MDCEREVMPKRETTNEMRRLTRQFNRALSARYEQEHGNYQGFDDWPVKLFCATAAIVYDKPIENSGQLEILNKTIDWLLNNENEYGYNSLEEAIEGALEDAISSSEIIHASLLALLRYRLKGPRLEVEIKDQPEQLMPGLLDTNKMQQAAREAFINADLLKGHARSSQRSARKAEADGDTALAAAYTQATTDWRNREQSARLGGQVLELVAKHEAKVRECLRACEAADA